MPEILCRLVINARQPGFRDYFISVGIVSCDEGGSVVLHDRRYDSIHLSVLNRVQFIGLVNLDTHISSQ
jgi:lipopolysaccharide transport system ATP-binding protein